MCGGGRVRSDADGGGGMPDELRISSTDLCGSGNLGGDMRDFVGSTCGELGSECPWLWWLEWWWMWLCWLYGCERFLASRAVCEP
jgi:hypothetical protein